MIDNYLQPDILPCDSTLRLEKYYDDFETTFPWYQDLTLCKQVDNIDFSYDLARLNDMYHYLSNKGECYYIEMLEKNKWIKVGDISLHEGEISIVIAPTFQNKHIGRKATICLINRAKEINLTEVKAIIYTFNKQSQKMFLSLGFVSIDEEKYIYKIEKTK